MHQPRETSPLANIECPPVSEADRDRAKLTVAQYATGADDLRMLLAILGLDEGA